jgi:uncharacterized protein YecE (DUF72 family)
MSEAAEATRQRAASRSEVRHGRILRLRGSEELYASDYSDEALDGWAARIRSWRAGGEPNDARLIDRSTRPSRRPRDVYVYFDNDAKVRAPYDARFAASQARRPQPAMNRSILR